LADRRSFSGGGQFRQGDPRGLKPRPAGQCERAGVVDVVTKRIVVVAAVSALAACGLQKQSAPSFTGPSELGLSISVTASPDVITQDGVSTSAIQIMARDANNQPVSRAFRAEIFVAGVRVDFGTLSTPVPSTGPDGRASFLYRSPAPPPPGTDAPATDVTIAVTPVGDNFANNVSRQVLIRLLRPGVIGPPNGAPTANFFFSPTQPKELETVLFDASTSTDPDGADDIASYAWTFGDGGADSGRQVAHRFDLAGEYNVTLVVTDEAGRSSAPTVKQITVGTATAPTASFVFSPTTPALDASGRAEVFFNAAASKPSPGFQIVSYDWDFGDGDRTSGSSTIEHTYTAVGTYTVVLTVSDSSGRKASNSQTVAVAGDKIMADFVFSPTDPVAGAAVSFNATTSKPSPGAAIVKYEWNFGGGAPGSTTSASPTASNTYASAGTYTVVLTVEDNTGQRASVAKTVVVKAP
jgi:PKD repeat protein